MKFRNFLIATLLTLSGLSIGQNQVFSKQGWNMYVGNRWKSALYHGHFTEGDTLTTRHVFLLRGTKVEGGTVISSSGASKDFTGLLVTIDQKGKVYLKQRNGSKLSVLKKGKVKIDTKKPIDLELDYHQGALRVQVNKQLVFEYKNPPIVGNKFGAFVNGTGSIQNKEFAMFSSSVIEVWKEGKIVSEAKELGISLVPSPIVTAALEDLGTGVNSEYENLSPKIAPDGRTLYYVKDGFVIPKIGDGTYNTYWVSKFMKDEWQRGKLVSSPFNRIKNGTGGNVTPDGNQMLVKGHYRNGKWLRRGFSMAYRTETGWSEPKPLTIKNFGLYDKGVTDYGYLCNDGRTIVFDADPIRGSYKNNLYVTFLQADGTWSEPKSLGPKINAPDAYTVTPFLAADGKTLYFSSNGWPGYGDNDIFVSKRLDNSWTNWSKPLNLGPAINSPKWDAYFNTDAAGKYSYMSTKRSSKKSKIYRIALNESSAPEPILLVKGKVFDTDSKRAIGTRVVVTNLANGAILGNAYSDPSDGFYEIVLPKGLEYGFYAESNGYLSVRENLSVVALDEYQEVSQDLGLAPIKAGQKIELRNVFFVRSKAVLMPKSLPELNKLVSMLKENASLRIAVHGHTSNTGTVDGNVQLSKQRAEKIKKYLVDHGIEASRLETEGFGPHKPIAPNDTEENRSKNRRVEFVVL